MKKVVQAVFVFSALLGVQSLTASAESTAEACAALVDDGARLACFDRLFSVPVEGAPPARSEKASPAPPAIEAQVQRAVEERAASPIPSVAPQAAEATPRSVARLRQTPRGRWIIGLDDGSEWLQLDDRPLPVALGRSVSLRDGLLGGQFLRPADGAGRSIKVERLR